jgi:hypothetical protein
VFLSFNTQTSPTYFKTAVAVVFSFMGYFAQYKNECAFYKWNLEVTQVTFTRHVGTLVIIPSWFCFALCILCQLHVLPYRPYYQCCNYTGQCLHTKHWADTTQQCDNTKICRYTRHLIVLYTRLRNAFRLNVFIVIILNIFPPDFACGCIPHSCILS